MSDSFGLGMAGGNAMNLGDTFSQKYGTELEF